MSLRYQIGIRILVVSLCIVLIGGSIAVWQARNAVQEEVDSSIRLALQLVNLGLHPGRTIETGTTDWLQRLGNLDQTRHLTIHLQRANGETAVLSGAHRSNDHGNRPPPWFVHLVAGEYPSVEHRLATSDNTPLTLVIQANPLDEITEIWEESVAFFLTVCLLIASNFLAVHLVFRKALHTIDTIVTSLRCIETGEFGKKLPEFKTLEFGTIARAINHMTDVLKKTRQQNRALTRHSLQIQEEQRQHLAQELHDEFGQSLTAIKVMAVSATHERSDTDKIIASIIDQCNHLMTVVRSMMQQLHPLALSELGLKAGLEDLITLWSRRHPEMSFILRCDDRVDRLNQAAAIQLFRVIQECLTNTIRHAGAQRATITLMVDRDRNRLQLIVADDGRGFHVDSVEPGFGLLGIQERIRSLNGEVSIESRPGDGMQVRAQIPIQ